MTWDGVPWFVGGGAEHSAEVTRLLAFAAFRGNEGIVGADDLKVTALPTPGGSVNVAPGAAVILARDAGQTYQAYGGRNPSQDTVAIAPTDASGGRSDLVVVRIEDPNNAGSGWQAPADPTVGPYIFTRVISNVPSTTTDVESLNLGYSAIALARIDVPVSTSAITDAMIVDLRKVANPRRERSQMFVFPSVGDSLTSSSYVTFPSQATWSVDVPEWATHAIVHSITQGVHYSGAITGQERVSLGTVKGQNCPYDLSAPTSGRVDRVNLIAADEIAIPSSMRGTTQTLSIEALRSGGDAGSDLGSGSWITALIDVEFLERSN